MVPCGADVSVTLPALDASEYRFAWGAADEENSQMKLNALPIRRLLENAPGKDGTETVLPEARHLLLIVAPLSLPLIFQKNKDHMVLE